MPFAFAFGAVHGDVGGAQQVVGIFAVARAARDADARVHVQTHAVHVDGRAHGGQQTLREFARDIGLFVVRGEREHGEFVAAKTRDGIALAHVAAQPRGDFAEHGVAGRVAIQVVHGLEAVEVDHDHEIAAAATARLFERGAHLRREQATVGQAGERIVARERLGVRLGGARGFVCVFQFARPRAERVESLGHRADFVGAFEVGQRVNLFAASEPHERIGDREQGLQHRALDMAEQRDAEQQRETGDRERGFERALDELARVASRIVNAERTFVAGRLQAVVAQVAQVRFAQALAVDQHEARGHGLHVVERVRGAFVAFAEFIAVAIRVTILERVCGRFRFCGFGMFERMVHGEQLTREQQRLRGEQHDENADVQLRARADRAAQCSARATQRPGIARLRRSGRGLHGVIHRRSSR
nr:hypothetical protein [Paraburkholderia tropica]